MRLKLRTKMLLVLTITGLLPVLSLGWIGLGLAEKAIKKRAGSELEAIRVLKKQSVTQYIETIKKQITTFTRSPGLAKEILKLRKNFYGVVIEDEKPTADNEKLIEYYQKNIIDNIVKKDPNNEFKASSLVNQLNQRSLFFQNKYLANEVHLNNNNLTKRNQYIINNFENTAYILREELFPIRETYDYIDLFIIDFTSGDILFSFKTGGIEFSSSLTTGPLANSSLATVYEKAIALSNDGTVFADYSPYLGSSNNTASFIAAPIYLSEKPIAVLAIEFGISALDKIMLKSEKSGKPVLTYLVGQDKLIRSGPSLVQKTKAFNQDLNFVDSESVRLGLTGASGVITTTNPLNSYVLSSFGSVGIYDTKWVLITEMNIAEAFSAMVTFRRLVVFSLVATTLAILFISFYFTGNIMRPLGGEPGYMLKIASEIANGDLTRDFSKHKSTSTGVHQALGNMCQNLRKLIGGVVVASEKQRSSSAALASLSSSNLKSIETQTAKLLQVVTAMEQMTASAREITYNTSNTAKKTNDARELINGSAIEVDNASNQMVDLVSDFNNIKSKTSQLTDSTNNISIILDTISKISDQTNLLALNAAIEAARAGEHGRGFAVVADEVRSLAQSSQKAAEEIAELISSLQKISGDTQICVDNGTVKVETVAKIASNSTNKLNEAVFAVESITDMTQNMANAANEQFVVAEHVNKTLVEINDMSKETSSSMLQLTESTSMLKELSETLKKQTDRFILVEREHK